MPGTNHTSADNHTSGMSESARSTGDPARSATEFTLSMNNITLMGSKGPIVQDITFELGRGQFGVLIGPTGGGKTTILRLAHFDRRPDSGVVRVGRYTSERMTTAQLPEVRRHIGMVFQDFKLLEDRPAYDNVALALEISGMSRRFVRRRTIDLLNQVGLGAKRRIRPPLLSGGEQQRLGIARALAYDPHVLLADEPTGNLDLAASESIMALLRRINDRGTTILMATHDIDRIRGYGYPCWYVEQGTIRPTDPS